MALPHLHHCLQRFDGRLDGLLIGSFSCSFPILSIIGGLDVFVVTLVTWLVDWLVEVGSFSRIGFLI